MTTTPMTPERLAEIRDATTGVCGSMRKELLAEVERLRAENERLLSQRRSICEMGDSEIDKLRDWQKRVVKYHDYLAGIISEAKGDSNE